ncbi:MAG: T9SS type A sorting domain-containing protein [Chitinophagales bacterium]
MKKIFILLVSSIIFSNIATAQVIEDSVDMNANFTMDVFYSLDNGTLETVANSEWTVALSTGAQTSSAYINDGKEVKLYETSVAIADFNNNLDTAGISTWTNVYNNYNDWEHSAFETGATGHPNYGWGDYNSTTHIITGDKVFVLASLNNTYYKTTIIKKEGGAWHFRYATLNNSFDTTIVYQATDLQDRNFAYLNMDNHLVANREPSNTEWDLLFTKYYDTDESEIVTGVLLNKGAEVVEIDGTSPASASYEDETFDATTKSIGSDWKQYNGTTALYDLDNDRTYFVKQLNGAIYKLNFTRFDGTSTGKIGFTKEKLVASAVKDIAAIKTVSLYPNPAKGNAFIALDLKQKANISYAISNMIGKVVAQNTAELNSGLNVLKLNTSNLNTGIYLVQIKNGKETQTLKLSVSK